MRTISVRFSYLAAVLGIAGLFQIYNAPTSAAAPNPESCFTTTGVATRTITDYNPAGVGCGAVVEIPSTIGGGTVVAIGNTAFFFNQLTSVIMPNTVTSIGTSAFSTNQLTSVTLSNSLTSIGNNAFYGNQLTSVTIPNSVTSIGNAAFQSNQLASVTISSSLTTIGDYVFSGNDLTSLTIPSSVTTIGINAFRDNQLTSVTIPNTVTSLGAASFSLNQLTSISIPNSITSIANGVFAGNQLVSITIPSTVTSIGNGAFSSNQLASVTIPNTVTSLGTGAFAGNQLTSVTLSNSLTSIGDDTFRENKLTSVIIPDSVTSVSVWAFILQSPHGRYFYDFIGPGDPVESQAAVDGIWYVNLYTQSPSNPNGLQDILTYDTAELDGLGPDYDELFIAGGYIVNATSAELQFIDAATNELLDPVILTGQTPTGSVYYHDYVVQDGPTIPTPADPWSPTAGELLAIRTALAEYYRAGDTLSYTAPPVNGITPTPASYSFVLGANSEDNERQFVYAAATSSPSSQATGLANTGISLWLIVAAAGAVIIGSMGFIARR